MDMPEAMLNNDKRLEFSWYDYGLFGAMLLLSTAIGIYFGFVKKQNTSNDYLFGGRQMSIVPIAASMVASFLSGITLLALPAHVYSYGIAYWLSVPSFISNAAITYFIYLPVFYELQITSIYEYLAQRFDTKVRNFASALFVCSSFLYLPIVIYVPALAFSQATGISINLITPIICAVCVFYTALGGLKAVVWTDALQFVIMMGSLVAILFLGKTSAGGFENIWHKSLEGKRLNIDFSFDITNSEAFWSSGIGLSVNWLCYTACNQGIMQKCIALPNYKAVRSALIIFALGSIAITTISAFTGLIMLAKYFECDPLLSGKIEEPDQILTYYIMDVAKTLPGLPGIFTAGIFSAALSTLSAVINCLSATIYKDFLSKYLKKNTSEKTISNYLKLLSVSIGIVCTSLVYVVPYLGTLVPLTVSLSGVADGASFGIFTSALLFPSINAKGALYGGIASLLFMTWTVFGSQYYSSIKAITKPPLPLNTEGCSNFTMQDIYINVNSTVVEQPFILYRISFYYYITIGTLIAIFVGLIISKLTPQYDKKVDKKYFSPIIRNLVSPDKHHEYYSLKQTGKNEICY